MSGLFIDVDAADAFNEARDDGLAELGVLDRELAHEPERLDPAHDGVRCECGLRSPNVCCPGCGARLRPPGSAGEIQWMRNHGFVPTLRDLNRLGVG